MKTKTAIPFVSGCVLLYVALALAMPRYFPLMEADSPGYIEFSANRTALYPFVLRFLAWLGLDLVQVTYVQLAAFAVALTVLLAALLRARVPRTLIVVFVVALGLNGYFSTFAFTIMTESLFFTINAIAVAFWLDYFRTGRVGFLAVASLCVGLLVGIRPAGLGLIPLLLISAWLRWNRRNTSGAVLVAAVLVPFAASIALEAIAHRTVHDHRESILTYVLFGKAAMLVKSDTVFHGPHAEPLNRIGKLLAAEYAPVHKFLSGVPLTALPVVVAGYEGVGQFLTLHREIAEESKASHVPVDVLRAELGEQSILANIPGYLRLTLTHYYGQWSVMCLTFPPTTRALNSYVAAYPEVPLKDKVNPLFIHPPSKYTSIVVYPAFLLAGVATLALSFVLIAFVVRRGLGDSEAGQYFMISSFFAATCHVYTFIISLPNVSTPRFLMAVYPQLVLAGIFLLMSARARRNEPAPTSFPPIAAI